MTGPCGQALTDSLDTVSVGVGIRPTLLADHAGTAYAADRTSAYRKSHGQYMTPQAVADFMTAMIEPRTAAVRLLDPAAGTGVLLCAAIEHLVGHPNRPLTIEVVAYEIDIALCSLLQSVLDYATTWAAERGVFINSTILQSDFILANAHALNGDSREQFDVVIANPPYFKIGKDDPRAIAAQSIVHGQPNIYGLFMAVGASLVKPHGALIYITPRSFTLGPYFRRLREYFFNMMRPIYAHVFGSRSEAFSRDSVLQENVILHAVRDDCWMASSDQHSFTISSSAGVTDLANRREWCAKLSDVLDVEEPGSILRLPTSPEDGAVMRLVDQWGNTLSSYGLVISTGPVVPFRATKWLAEQSNTFTVPLIWMSHVKPMQVHWPNGTRKPQYIHSGLEGKRALLPRRNYVVLRRFSTKEQHRRLTAAPLLVEDIATPMLGLENHLNYIHRPHGNLSRDEAWGLAALYNSSLFDTYLRSINGSTQVGATELRVIPLPPIEEIITLGKRVRSARAPLTIIDNLVMSIATGCCLNHVGWQEIPSNTE